MKSEIIRVIGLEVVRLIQDEIDSIDTHPMRFQFYEDETKEISEYARKEEATRLKYLVINYFDRIYRKSIDA